MSLVKTTDSLPVRGDSTAPKSSSRSRLPSPAHAEPYVQSTPRCTTSLARRILKERPPFVDRATQTRQATPVADPGLPIAASLALPAWSVAYMATSTRPEPSAATVG